MESEVTNKDLLDELRKLKIDVDLIKCKLNEDELTDWAKQKLEEARKRDNKMSHEDVKKFILAR